MREVTIREAQERLTGALVAIDHVLTQASVDYWLDGGTLLGAYRNGSFIPWDDDADLAVFDVDLAGALDVLERELPAGLRLNRNPGPAVSATVEVLAVQGEYFSPLADELQPISVTSQP